MSLHTQLRGTGVALVTPFSESGSIDFNALHQLIDSVIAGGVNYLVTLGTTGETPVLSKEEKKAIADFTLEKAQGRVPVVIGIGGNHTAAVIEEFSILEAGRFAAVLSASPYYNKPSQEGLYQHYKAIADAAPVPVILYNVPGRTGRNLEANTTLRLAVHPNIIGIKEASGDMAQCMKILKDRPDHFLVVSGDDALVLPQIACGMEGVISVAANSFPEPFCKMVQYCLKGEFSAAKVLNDKLIDIYDLLFAENNPAGVKAALFIKGLIKNEVRLPVVPLSAPLLEKLKEKMANTLG